MPNTKIQPGTINILLKLLVRIKNYVFETAPNEQIKKLIKEEIEKGESGLYKTIPVINNGKAYSEPMPEYNGKHYPREDGWQSCIAEEIAQFNCNGAAYITRVSECIIKIFGLINTYQGENARSLALFRGQHNAEWDVISSIGRIIPTDKIQEDLSTVSQFELTSLRDWQDLVNSSPDLHNEIFGSNDPYGNEDPRWWPLKQHYEGGTRLVDWTSSPLCALYFACVDWGGKIHTDVDGGLYASMKRLGRRFINKATYDSLSNFEKEVCDCAGDTVSNYFDLKGHYKYTRSLIGESESDRQLAQDGHFMFKSNFNESFDEWDGGTPFFFVIPKEYKIPIMRELYSIGYTPEKIIRGRKGLEAHKVLKEQLGILELGDI